MANRELDRPDLKASDYDLPIQLEERIVLIKKLFELALRLDHLASILQGADGEISSHGVVQVGIPGAEISGFDENNLNENNLNAVNSNSGTTSRKASLLSSNSANMDLAIVPSRSGQISGVQFADAVADATGAGGVNMTQESSESQLQVATMADQSTAIITNANAPEGPSENAKTTRVNVRAGLGTLLRSMLVCEVEPWDWEPVPRPPGHYSGLVTRQVWVVVAVVDAENEADNLMGSAVNDTWGNDGNNSTQNGSIGNGDANDANGDANASNVSSISLESLLKTSLSNIVVERGRIVDPNDSSSSQEKQLKNPNYMDSTRAYLSQDEALRGVEANLRALCRRQIAGSSVGISSPNARPSEQEKKATPKGNAKGKAKGKAKSKAKSKKKTEKKGNEESAVDGENDAEDGANPSGNVDAEGEHAVENDVEEEEVGVEADVDAEGTIPGAGTDQDVVAVEASDADESNAEESNAMIPNAEAPLLVLSEGTHQAADDWEEDGDTMFGGADDEFGADDTMFGGADDDFGGGGGDNFGDNFAGNDGDDFGEDYGDGFGQNDGTFEGVLGEDNGYYGFGDDDFGVDNNANHNEDNANHNNADTNAEKLGDKMEVEPEHEETFPEETFQKLLKTKKVILRSFFTGEAQCQICGRGMPGGANARWSNGYLVREIYLQDFRIIKNNY
jgi:hypothetical protein